MKTNNQQSTPAAYTVINGRLYIVDALPPVTAAATTVINGRLYVVQAWN